MTALRSLVSHHDVTWIASAIGDEDRAVAAEAGGRRRGDRARRLAVPAAPRRARRRRVRLVLQRRREPGAVVPPALPLEPRRTAPDLDQGLHHAWEEGYVPVNRAFADAVVGRARGASPTRPSSSTTTTSTSRRASCASSIPTRRCALRPHPVAAVRLLARAARADPASPSTTGLLANDVVGFHTERWKRELPAHLRRHRARRLRSTPSACATFGRPAHAGHEPSDLRRPARVRRARASRRRCSPPSARSWRARPEKLILRVDRTDPSKNVVRGFRAFEHFLETHPEQRGRVDDARAARPVASGHPRVLGVPGRDPADRAAR